MSGININEWEVELLRLTAFTNDLIPPSHFEEWWKKVAKTDAESVNRKPALGAFTAMGPVDDAGLQLAVTPGRVDWLFGPTTVEAVLEHSLGKYDAQDERFGQRLSDWLQLPAISINRLALGEVLRMPVPNRVEGYKTAAKLLPCVKLDPRTSKDFMFQINRPRESKVIPGLSINRLTKWAIVQMNVGVIGSEKPASSAEFVRLELDISTDKDSQRDLSKDNGLSRLYEEFIGLCREIATKGDAP